MIGANIQSVSHAQMVQDTLRKLYVLSKLPNWVSFLSIAGEAGDWIRSINVDAEDLLGSLAARYETYAPSR